ncbi:PREDICTED: receptor-like cytosolic serine/threonine-protein kinase RBK2 isoform X1 [Theobroma cacao]|uniref:non-specific serine/threonine protein kinase n=1 Tax=Theobroma cacao TaxID=3641 RepID=A0AB32VCL0_THECC|nr:PREDICTED: receptor-like cytosolic serine/threonine-protein kinase RBK2 isoform X1 [Theobroma cacao]
MRDAREPNSAPSCGELSVDSNGSHKTARKWEPFRHIRRRHRAGFSDSISSLDLASLGAEVERIDQPSPTAALEDCSTSLESIESRSVESIESAESEPTSSKASTSSDSENHQSSATSVHWRGFFRLLKKGPGIPFQTLPPLKPRLTRRKSKRVRDDMVPQLSSTLDAELCCFKSTWKNFSLSELHEATNNFSHENLIGEGGYAEVYKGQLKSGKLVAIKRLTRGSSEEMTMDFLSELGIIVHVDHPNIAKLIGYGVEGGMHLVLQLSPHGSLASLLYGPKEKLSWGIRFKIAVGTAEGLSYLHEGCQRRIIHKDIKASNILLTEDFDAQISDFGLAKWLPDQWTHHTVSRVEGTFGYLPPEFFMHGIVDEKTDVYAFGVLLLELITGRQAVDSSQQSLVMWAKPLIKENKIEELVDPTLGDAYNVDQLNRVTATASMCIHQSAVNRPQMSQVVDILKGDLTCLEMLKHREKSILQRTYSEEIHDAEEYNSTKYLNDLRQMEILLGQPNEELC